MRKSNKVAAMRVRGANVDAKTGPSFFIDHDSATVGIACPSIPYFKPFSIIRSVSIYV